MSSPAKTGLSRVFLIEGRARPDHDPTYKNTMRMGSLSQALGDIEKIEVPDPNQYGAYIEIGQVRGANERVETSLEGRYFLDLLSDMLRLAQNNCPMDVQLHMGSCQDPTNFDDFDKALILEDAVITNFSTEDLGSLASGDEAPVNETVDLSARKVYEVMQLSFTRRADDDITNEIVDVVICGNKSCGDCDDENSGCDKIYAVTLAAGGSPGTPPDVVFSIDKGVTWYAHDIDTLTSVQDPSGVGCIGTYLVVISNGAGSLSYALLSEFDGTSDPAFTEVTTGFVAGGEPNDISVVGTTAFIVGDGGYVYKTTDPTGGVSVSDAGVAVTDNLLAVDALSTTFAVAVGQNGAIVKTEDGAIWAEVTPRIVGAGIHLNTVSVKSEKEWLIGTSGGDLYHTTDGGVTFTLKTFSGSGTGSVEAVLHVTDSVVFMSHQTAGTAGRLFRSYNGGNSWILLPEGSANLPANDSLNALAGCSEDPNFIVAGGLADDASDGILLTGSV